MDSHRVTRRRFVGGAVASTIAAGIALDTGAASGAIGGDGDLVVGRFVGARGPRSGIVSLAGGQNVPVTLDSQAFVAHGADGVVDSLGRFVPGEQVVVRGARTEREIVAVELQSVYTSVTGTITPDGAAYAMRTASGRVRVPRNVVERDVPAGIRGGETVAATIWTHPVTGAATAVDVSLGS